jgi:tetratricopeptide (TPR) repeat protein
MSSQEQIDANRRNGALSNGPKTLGGKATSSKNAVKHGLLSDDALLPGEDKGKFEQFANLLRTDLSPHGELESALVDRIIGLMWRQHRIGKLEAAILFWQRCLVANPPAWQNKHTPSHESVLAVKYVEYEMAPQRRANALEYAQKTDAVEQASAGEAYIRGENSLAKLSRYESALNRNLLRLLHELQRLQAARKGEHVPPPQVVDIDVTGLPEPSRADDQLPQGD